MLALGLAATLVQLQPMPNVVIFLVDDLGWQDTSLAFGIDAKVVGRHFRTPNLDALARRGVTVNQAYASCPVCTPTRAALLTGVNPARSHITSWVHSGQETEGNHPNAKNPDWRKIGLQPGDATTLPSAMSAWDSAQFGKAHFGAAGTEGASPVKLGFSQTVGGSAAGHPSSYYGTQNFARSTEPDAQPAHNDVPDLDEYHGQDIYLDEALALEAVKFIKSTPRPKLVWFAPYAVHTPIQPNKRLLGPYAALDEREAAYATMVETVDNALGSLVTALHDAGELERTIIIFTSDNGGLSQSSRGGYPNLHNLPLRSGKGSAYEGGIRVPLVVAGPGIARGKVLDDTYLSSVDLYDTVLALTRTPGDGPDGESFAAQFASGEDEERTRPEVWHFPVYRGGGGPGLEPFTAIRAGRFKAIFFYGDRRWELYNLRNDLGETVDLSLRNKPKLHELANLMVKRLDEMGAQFPTDPATGVEIRPHVPPAD